MVSNIVYRSHKALKIKTIKPFKLLSSLVFVIALLIWLQDGGPVLFRQRRTGVGGRHRQRRQEA